jgi:hypothetical protein
LDSGDGKVPPDTTSKDEMGPKNPQKTKKQNKNLKKSCVF